MENLNSLFERDKKREEEFEKLKKALKKDRNRLNKYKELARGDKGGSLDDINEARLNLFMMGETYMNPPTVEKKVDQIESWGKKSFEKEEKYGNGLKKEIEERGLPKDLKEIEDFLTQKEMEASLDEKSTPKATKILKDIERLYKKKPEKFEEAQRKLMKKFAKEFLENGDRSLVEESLRSDESIERSKKLQKELKKIPKTKFPYKPGKMPGYLANLLEESGRIDLLYWDKPNEIVKHLKRMDLGGLPVSKLSPEVWRCPAFIDALSDGQLYELATEGNPSALMHLRKTVTENAWLLVGNTSTKPGDYRRRHGTGVSKFVLKSALALDIGAFNEFLEGAQELMPHAENEADEKEKGDNTFEGWTKELLSKETGEDVLAWDDKAFKPKINKTKNNPEGEDNPIFNLFTRFAHPGQLGLIPPNGTLAEKRKPIITDLLIDNKEDYENEMTKKYIGELEKIIKGKETGSEGNTEKQEELATAETEIKNLKENLERKEKEINHLEVNREEVARSIVSALERVDELAKTLSSEQKRNNLYLALETTRKSVIAAVDGLEESAKVEMEFDKKYHVHADITPTGSSNTINEVVEPGYKYKNTMLKPARVRVR